MASAAALLYGARELRAEPARSFAGLAAEIERIEATRGGRLGVAVLDSGTGHRVAHRGDERFPMASTFKLLLAGATLSRVDAGTESLDRRIRFGREDLVTYSPVTERHVATVSRSRSCARRPPR
jgi:beta-lactamase class A